MTEPKTQCPCGLSFPDVLSLALLLFLSFKKHPSKNHLHKPIRQVSTGKTGWVSGSVFAVVHRIVRQAVVYRLFFRFGSSKYYLVSAIAVIISFFREDGWRDLFRLSKWTRFVRLPEQETLHPHVSTVVSFPIVAQTMRFVFPSLFFPSTLFSLLTPKLTVSSFPCSHICLRQGTTAMIRSILYSLAFIIPFDRLWTGFEKSRRNSNAKKLTYFICTALFSQLWLCVNTDRARMYSIPPNLRRVSSSFLFIRLLPVHTPIFPPPWSSLILTPSTSCRNRSKAVDLTVEEASRDSRVKRGKILCRCVP